MEQDKVVILGLIDPFGEKPYLAEKTYDELMEIFDKLNNNLYEYSHKDYAPSRVLQTLAKKFRDVSSREQELVRREEAVRKKETEYGIRSQLRTRELSEPPRKLSESTRKLSEPASVKREKQVTPKSVLKKPKEAVSEHVDVKPAVKETEYVRPPDPVIRTRLIEEDHEDPELEYAMKLSSDAFYGRSDVKAAVSKSMEDARREEDESYKQLEIRRAREEFYMKQHAQEQDDFDDAFAASLKPKTVTVAYDDSEEINIDIEKFTDRPSEVTPEILKEICIALKKQDFDGARSIIGKLSAASSSWIVRLKCEKGTLKSKIVSRDVEAYKCILCRN